MKKTKLTETTKATKNQINVGRVGKGNVIANGDNAIAIGKNTKTTKKKSIWAIIIDAIATVIAAIFK